MKDYIFKYKYLLVLTVAIRCIGAAMQVYIALLIQQLIDAVVGGDMNAFSSMIVFAVVYFSLMGLVDYLTSTTQACYLKKTLVALKQDIFKGLISKDYASFHENNTADYLSNLTNDINLIETNYITPFLMMIGDVVIFIGTTAVLLWINPWVTVAMFAIAILLMVVPALFGRALESRQNQVSTEQSIFTTRIKDILEGYEVVKSYRMTKSVTTEFNAVNKTLEQYKFKSAHLKGVAQAISMMFAIGTQIAGMAIAGYFVIKGNMSVGNLFAVVQLGNGIQGPIMWIMQKVTMIKGMSGVNEKILAIIQEGQKESNERALSSFEESIILEDVSFAYEEDMPVLKGISYTFEKSKKYAIVGESGCGKSTLIKLMMGYYRNYDGKILVDQQDVNGATPLSVNELASMIHQNVYLFDKTIEDNVLLNHHFSDAQINQALTQSGVAKFMSQLTDGLNTSVGENGKNLSGGQKQRVAIARALIQQMPILMLDEGTSALDLQTAYDIERTLLGIGELTVITITHKLSEEILSQYDEIIVMDHGQIVEAGTFDELVQRQGAFYKLYTLKQEECAIPLAG
ncbi:MAG: ABC transporter ATP-binding protein [Turicibacter bilis]|nr:ABC transporter ATP-binding protein [Turicibacter bilis]